MASRNFHDHRFFAQLESPYVVESILTLLWCETVARCKTTGSRITAVAIRQHIGRLGRQSLPMPSSVVRAALGPSTYERPSASRPRRSIES
ncbi:hypothetical protein KTD08_01385 [Burkholderia multivorans]|uniref:hypothetical protein n=1 Tax=Burkholderia multivorans TaxID=87883 RepID=UPI001C24B5B9|nr:hypothetical protein [Burkholderia multivorans]MBU9123835.1 hypothetical protein [Burkholderia multivorans]